MKFLQSITLLVFTFILVNSSFSQRAKDGNYTASTANNVVNSYTFLTADAGAGGTAISVANNSMVGGVFGGALAAGDLILIIQMQGVQMDVTNYPVTNGWGPYTTPFGFTFSGDWPEHVEAWGAVTNYLNAGLYEKIEVLSVTGANVINLQCPLKFNYTASGHTQIVRIPRFDNLTVTGGANAIIPTLWNGQTGGVVAIEVETNLNIAAGSSISASEFGFRAGQLDGVGSSGGTGNVNEVRFAGSPNANEGSEKGEGLFGYYTEYDALSSRYGIGAPANGGGGGGYQNCGGGGGSNIGSGYYTGNGIPDPTYNTSWALDFSNPPNPNPSIAPTAVTFTSLNGTSSPGGGRGGYALSDSDQNELTVGPRNASWGGDARKTNGGKGGHPLIYDANRLFFGGGGGAGDQDSGEGGAGGRGGGLVYIVNYGSTTGSGTIEADGQNGENSNPANLPADGSTVRRGNDGAGGGGAGGSIYIENTTAIPNTINLTTIGGNGGNHNITVANAFISSEAAGPGGSGAGGSIAFSNGTPTQNVTAGSNGISISSHVTNFPPNGATNGASGVGSLSAPFFDLTGSDVTICGSGVANLSVTVVGSLPGGSSVQWYTQQFGGASVGSGTTYTTPVISSTTTYYAGVCPGSFRIPIVVTVTSAPNLVITNPAAVCSPNTVDITVAAITAGSDAGTLTYWTDAAATVSYATPNAATNGTYYIQLDAGGGCTVVQPVTVTVTPLEDASFTMTPTCNGGTAVVSGTAGGTFTFNVAPGDAAVINSATGEVTGGTSGSSYDVLYTTTGTCFATSIVTVTAYTVSYSVTIVPENCGAGDGEIQLAGSGGDGGPYQYSITGAAPYSLGGTFNSLSAGSYSISVLDNSGCEVTGTEAVNGTGGPSIDNLAITNPTCSGDCDGQIVATVSGGTVPYTYQWFDASNNSIGTNSATITGLCAGDYSVQVTDVSGGMVVLFTEDFGTDASACDSQGTLASGYNSGAGAWTITSTGTNDADANLWFVSSMEAGVGSGNCGVGCSAVELSRTLHVSNPDIPAFGLSADQGAAYNAGGLCPTFFCVDTDVRAESPSINLSSTGMTMTFDYIHLGDGSDECEILYFDGTVWNSLGILPNTSTGACNPQHLWAQYSWIIPATLNGLATFQVGFRWTNNDDGVGTDPSVAIDNIQISSAGAGCPVTSNTTLTDPAALNLTITDPVAVCSPTTVDITAVAVTAGSDVGTLTYWTNAAATTSLGTPGAVTTSGTYYIQLTIGACSIVQPVTVIVNTPIAPTFAAIADVCQNATAPVLPTTFTNGVTGTWSPAVSTTTVGTTTYTFTPTAGLCASSTTLDITIINIPVLDPIVDVVNCGNYSLPTITGTNLTGNEAYYNNSQALGGTLITGSITSTQTVWVYDGNGNCSSEISFNVTINAIPGITSMTGGGTYCQGDAVSDIVVNISGNPNWTLDYTLDGVVQQITSGSSPINLGNVPGVYVLTGLTDGNCPSVAAGTQTIVVNPIPSAPVLGPDLDFCATAIIDFMTGTGTAGGTLYWYDDPALNLLDLVGTGQAVYPSNAVGVTTYYVQDDVNGCLSPVSTINITINDCEVIIPTAFTPDGDFNNDTWEIPGLDDKYPDNIVRIYNRWGNLIYEHASSLTVPYSGNQWDGKYKGKLLPVGSYFFIIDTNNSETKVLKGSISIILNK